MTLHTLRLKKGKNILIVSFESLSRVINFNNSFMFQIITGIIPKSVAI